MKKKFKKNTNDERIQFLRNAIRQATERDGVPCMCILCEALIFDYDASLGLINLKTGERNE